MNVLAHIHLANVSLMNALAATLVAITLCASVALGQNLNKDTADSVRAPQRAAAISPSDSVDLPNVTKGIWAATTGTLKVDMVSGGTVTLTGIPAGKFLPIAAKRVYATGTTVTGLIGFF